MDVRFIKTKIRRTSHVGGFVVQASKHIWLFILFLFIFIGLLSGNFLVKGNENTYKTVSELFKSYISSLSGQTLLKNFSVQLLINFSMLVISFIFGLSAVGLPIPIVLTLMKGISVGALSSFLYSQYSLKGFGYCMLVIYPVQIIISLIMLRAGNESINMSISLFKLISEQRTRQGNDSNLKMYLVRYLVLCLAVIIVSFISAILSVYATKLFEFNLLLL